MAQDSPLRLSPSAVKAFRDCPLRYALDYVRRLPDDQRAPTPALAVGNAVHKAIAVFIRAGGPRRVTKDEFVNLLTRHWDSAQFSGGDEEDRHRRRARQMVERFHDLPYPDSGGWDVAIERTVAWAAPRSGILATGRLDRVSMRPDSVLEVIDYKTSARPMSNDDMATDIQAVFYRTLAADAFRNLGAREIRIAFHYLDVSATAQITFGREVFKAAWREIESVASRIKASRAAAARRANGDLEAAFPRRPGLRCQGCPFRRHCGTERLPSA